MKKKILFFSLTLLLSLFTLVPVANNVYAEEDIVTLTQNDGYETSEAYRPAASIVIDADTGAVLWADNPDLAWNPASIAKLMAVYLVFDAISQGKFTLDSTVIATESDQAISQIYELSNNSITAGVAYPVRDLLYATLIASSNVATVMLANLVSSDDAAAFIHLMNAKAQELGMTNSTFYNPSGAASSSFNGYYIPDGIDLTADNITTARDLATLSYFLLKNYPDVLTYTSPTQVTIMKNTAYAETLENHNYSLPGLAYGYEGADGLKTGSSPTGGYNYAATAKRGNMRLIEIVLGVGTWDDQEGELQRHAFGNAIFDYSFTTYDYTLLLSPGLQTINGEEVILDQELYGTVAKTSEPTYLAQNNTVTLENALPQVAATIASPSATYHVQEQPNENIEPENSLMSQLKNSRAFFPSLVFVIVGLLLILLGKLTKPSRVATRRTKRTSPFTVLGLLIVISGSAVLLYIVLTKFL